MRVDIHLSKFHDWVPVPPDVRVTPEDIAAGKVMPARDGGYRMRVTKSVPGGVVRHLTISEQDVIGKIIHERADLKRAGRVFSRKEAVAHLIQDNLLDDLDWSWIMKIEVHDDGPDEMLARALLEPHTKAAHGRREGRTNIPAEALDQHLSAYMESATADHHVDHLHKHFGVKAVSK